MAALGTKMSPAKLSLASPATRAITKAQNGPQDDSHQRTAPLVSIRRAFLVVVDLLSIWAVALFAIGIRFPRPADGYSADEHASIEAHFGFLLLYSGLVVLFANTQQLYSRAGMPSARRDAIGLAKSTAMAALLLTAFIYLSRNQLMSRLVVNVTITLNFLAMFGWRCWRRRWLRTAPADGFTCHNALIIGSNDVAQMVRAHLDKHRELGLAVQGFLSDATEVPPGRKGWLGTFDALEKVARANFIDEVIICTPERDAVKSLIQRARHCGISVRVVPDLYDGLAWGAPIDYLGEIPSMYLHQKRIPAAALFAKRIIDTLLAGVALLALAPSFAALAILISIDSPGPVLYVSRRVGRKGNIFSCYKFRTMVVDAERLKADLHHLNERDGVLFKISNDPRITRVGRFLRKYSLDEFGQLWNVFRGDMSLVGPRPPLANEVEKYQLDHLRRLEVAPGITGLWQVEARTNPSFERYIELDLQYVRDWNLLLDLKIVLKTIAVVIAGTGQ